MRYKAEVKAITQKEIDRRIAALNRAYRGMVASILKIKGIQGATPGKVWRIAQAIKEASRG